MGGQDIQYFARSGSAGVAERVPADRALPPIRAIRDTRRRGGNAENDGRSAARRRPLIPPERRGRTPRALALQGLILCALAAFAAAGCNSSPSAPAGAQPSSGQSYSVNISPIRLQAISVTAAQTSLPLGQSEQLGATGWYSDGTTEQLRQGQIWTSSNTGILAVDSDGLAIGMALGSATVTVQDPVSQMQGSLSVTVTGATLESLSVNPVSSSLAVGLAVPLTAAGHFSDGTSLALTTGVTWQSGAPGIAAVDATGQATAVAVGGPVAITAAFEGQSAGAQVTVSALDAVTVSPALATIAPGRTAQLAATGSTADGGTPPLASGVTWTSSDDSVATVSAAGLVTAVSAGTVSVGAAYGGQTGTAQVTVSEP